MDTTLCPQFRAAASWVRLSICHAVKSTLPDVEPNEHTPLSRHPFPAVVCKHDGTLCEVHSVPQRQQSRNTEPRTWATCRETGEHWARSSGDMLTDRQTDRHAHHNTQLRYWGRSNEMGTATANNITKLLNNKLVQTTITHIWSEYCVQTLHQNITNNAASRNTSTAAVSYTVSVYLSIYAVRDC